MHPECSLFVELQFEGEKSPDEGDKGSRLDARSFVWREVGRGYNTCQQYHGT